MNKTSRQRANNAGFTLIEVMIAMAVMAIAMVGIYNLFAKNMKAHVSQELTLELTQDLRAVLNLMTTEIRMAGYDPLNSAGAGFVDNADDRYNTDTSTIRFTMDLWDGASIATPDGDALDTGEDINYYVDATGSLIRRIYDASVPGFVEGVAAGNITDLTFTYLDGNNTATSVLANIRTVEISLTGKTRAEDPLLGQVKTRTETARIKVRNMGLPSS